MCLDGEVKVEERTERRSRENWVTLGAMTSDENAPVVFLVRLSAEDCDSLHLRVLGPSRPWRLSSRNAGFVLRLWWETADVLRASITSVESGSVAMVQGNRALHKLAKEAGLIRDSN
jgi:hypothetical protein